MTLVGVGLTLAGILVAVTAVLGHLGLVRSDPAGIALMGVVITLVGVGLFFLGTDIGRPAGRK